MIVFIVTFIVYLATLFPSVAPYRDSGEMVSVAHTLGVAHPPGYPLYTLISKLFLILMPLGSEGYRLNVLSAIAGGLTALLIYRILLALSVRKPVAACLALVFSFSYLQWYLSLVPEMYTVNTLFAAAVLYLAIRIAETPEKGDAGTPRLYYLLAFVSGLGLGIRMDLLLIAPGILWLIFKKRRSFSFGNHDVAGLLFAAGSSVFLYLLVRSNRGPLLDWNHPATLERLWGTLSRKTHGGTLDLISTGYAPGTNFPATIRFYFSHLLTGFAYVGLPLAAVGLVSLWKRKKDIALAMLAAWFVSGPVFIYLGNMPPNTHALAILEAHFLLPNIFVAVWIAVGFARFVETTFTARAALISACCAAAIAGYSLTKHYPDLNKRQNFVAYDYAKNVLRSLPPGSVAVMKKDVQLFALWNQQLVENKRPDLAIISQGLAGSSWYQDAFKKRHPETMLWPLRTKEDWQAFVRMNEKRRVFFTGDTEYKRPDGYREEAGGLTTEIATAKKAGNAGTLLSEIYPYRGKYLYTAYREFFTPDLIEEYARPHVQAGLGALERGEPANARGQFLDALRLQPLLPFAANYAGYTYFQEGRYDEAVRQYRDAVSQYGQMLGLADAYHSLPEAKDGLRKDLSDVYISLGVTAERLHKDNEGLSWYARAVEAWPGQEKAYFNRAVLLWKRNDWPGVTRELEQALRINPNYREAAYYLQLARQKMKQ